MKKNLFAFLLFILTAGAVRADLIWYEPYNYPDGQLILVSTNSDGSTNWMRNSGSGNDALVVNHQEQVSATGSTLSRQDDIQRLFPAPYTNNGPILVYASFTVIVTNLPSAVGTYFAHFTDGTSSNFLGRVFALTGNPAPGSAATNFAGLPNTFRLGIAGGAATVNKVFPVDLALNTPYQVVVSFDATVNEYGTLWVNPLNAGDFSVASSDTISASLQGKVLGAFAFRQASSFGNFFCLVTNLAIATTFDEAATNVWPATPVAPIIAYQPVGFNGNVGVSNGLFVVANGQSLTSLTYQWQINGTNVSNPSGNANLFPLPNPATTDSGDYTVIVSNPNTGLSVTSAVAHVSISANPVPPAITQQPASISVYNGQAVTLTVAATGPGPITYQWNYNSNILSGATDSTLSIPTVTSNNNTVGTYEVDVINQYGTTHSSNATVSVTAPQVVTINYLRGLVDPVFFLPTNTTSYFTTTGTVISKTNFTTAANYEFFMSDGTGGISVFIGGGLGSQFQPGDVVKVTGKIAQFSSLMEFSLSATDPAASVTLVSSGAPLVPKVLPITFTNSVAFGGVSNALRLYGSSLVMFTNVHFTASGNFAGNGTYSFYDQNGNGLVLFIYSGFAKIIGTPIPGACYTISGILSEFLSATATDRSAGYQLEISDPADLVLTAPPATTLSQATAGTVTWPAVPYSYSYSVLSATNVSGPYLPAATGLVFPTSAGSYADTNTTSSAKFYRVVSP